MIIVDAMRSDVAERATIGVPHYQDAGSRDDTLRRIHAGDDDGEILFVDLRVTVGVRTAQERRTDIPLQENADHIGCCGPLVTVGVAREGRGGRDSR